MASGAVKGAREVPAIDASLFLPSSSYDYEFRQIHLIKKEIRQGGVVLLDCL